MESFLHQWKLKFFSNITAKTIILLFKNMNIIFLTRIFFTVNFLYCELTRVVWFWLSLVLVIEWIEHLFIKTHVLRYLNCRSPLNQSWLLYCLYWTSRKLKPLFFSLWRYFLLNILFRFFFSTTQSFMVCSCPNWTDTLICIWIC